MKEESGIEADRYEVMPNFESGMERILEDGHQKVVGAKELFDGVIEQAEVR